MKQIVPNEVIEKKIFLIRGQKVMLDKSLAELYGVPTKVFLQEVKRNGRRFPRDFMFQLRPSEFKNLRSQFVTSSWGGRWYLPYAFTEQGVAMLSSVLNSEIKLDFMSTKIETKQCAQMTAESQPKEKNIIAALVVNLINKLN